MRLPEKRKGGGGIVRELVKLCRPGIRQKWYNIILQRNQRSTQVNIIDMINEGPLNIRT